MIFLHFLGIWAWLRWWSEARVRTKRKKVQKQKKKMDTKKESFFVRIRNVFWRFGGRSVSYESYLGTLFQTCCSKGGKTVFSSTPNIIFQRFEGLVWDVLGSLFQDLFWDGFGEMILRFFEKLKVQPVAPKTSFGEHFRYKCCIGFYRFLWKTGSTISQQVPAIYKLLESWNSNYSSLKVDNRQQTARWKNNR